MPVSNERLKELGCARIEEVNEFEVHNMAWELNNARKAIALLIQAGDTMVQMSRNGIAHRYWSRVKGEVGNGQGG